MLWLNLQSGLGVLKQRPIDGGTPTPTPTPSTFYRLTESSDRRITEAGDPRRTE